MKIRFKANKFIECDTEIVRYTPKREKRFIKTF